MGESDGLQPRRYRGYARLRDNEEEFTEYALSQHSDWANVWYELFNDYDRLLAEWQKLSSVPFPDHPRVHQLALHFALATGGTAKLAFDCAFAGYYAQALMMTRQLFETWMRIEYVKLVPEAADNWFPTVSGRNPQPPSQGTIQGKLQSQGDKDLKAMVTIVLGSMDYIQKASHASEYVFQQTVTDRPNHYQSGANYNLAQCVNVMNDGTTAFGLVLTALARLIGASRPLRASIVETSKQSREVAQRSAPGIDRYRQELRTNPHWILGPLKEEPDA